MRGQDKIVSTRLYRDGELVGEYPPQSSTYTSREYDQLEHNYYVEGVDETGLTSRSDSVQARALHSKLKMSDEVAPEKDAADALLYHYTSQKALMGILGNLTTMWASKIQYLNDEREYSWALDRAAQVAQDRWTQSADAAEKELYSRIQRQVEEVRGAHIFVASLSQNGDQLSQWRSYCGDGPGFSIGFSVEALERSCRREGWRLTKCTYDESVNMGVVLSLFDEHLHPFLEASRASASHSTSVVMQEVSARLVEDIALRGAAMKHPSFAEECEWRLVSPLMPESATHYREGRHTLIPYCSIELEGEERGEAVREVTVGPSSHPALSVHSCAAYIRKHGHRYATVTRTATPFRSW
jgi:hypothetical protein